MHPSSGAICKESMMEDNGNNQYQPFQQFQPNQPQPPYNQMLLPHRGTLILIFGIVGIVGCGIFAILAWLFGNEDLKKMNMGQMDPSGRDITNTGRILGIIGTGLMALGILGSIIYFVFIIGIAGAAASGF